MLSRHVVIHQNTCKKIATFLLLLSLCLVGRISAQINIYGVEHFTLSKVLVGEGLARAGEIYRIFESSHYEG